MGPANPLSSPPYRFSLIFDPLVVLDGLSGTAHEQNVLDVFYIGLNVPEGTPRVAIKIADVKSMVPCSYVSRVVFLFVCCFAEMRTHDRKQTQYDGYIFCTVGHS